MTAEVNVVSSLKTAVILKPLEKRESTLRTTERQRMRTGRGFFEQCSGGARVMAAHSGYRRRGRGGCLLVVPNGYRLAIRPEIGLIKF